jgi:4-amino-4-deoxy-L-arabinose transferase-like glycosyltransferase
MLTDTITRPSLRQHFLYAGIFVVPVLLLGVYLIANTVVIATDGTIFIQFAKDMQSNFKLAIDNNFQHPGYPYLLSKLYCIFGFFGFSGFWAWLWAAQGTSLLCNVVGLIFVYLIASRISGAKGGMLAALIIGLLPESIRIGANALSDWPHIMFMICAFLLLLISAENPKHFWISGLAGIAAGLGYLVRPESIQIIVYGVTWYLASSIKMPRQLWRNGAAVILLLTGFLIFAGPYMVSKGAIFPKKSIDLSPESTMVGDSENTPLIATISTDKAGAIGIAVSKVLGRLLKVLLFFTPFLILGAWLWFKTNWKFKPITVLLGSVLAWNFFILSWLYWRHGYLAQRHLLPMTALTVGFVPLAFRMVSDFLCSRREIQSGLQRLFGEFNKDKSAASCVMIFVMIGLVMALPRSVKPPGQGREALRQAAKWLNDNTPRDAVIAVPDLPIAFYAQRKGFRYEGRPIQNSKHEFEFVAEFISVKPEKNVKADYLCIWKKSLSNTMLSEASALSQLSDVKRGNMLIFKI